MISSEFISRLKSLLPEKVFVENPGQLGRFEDWKTSQPMNSPLLLRPSSTQEVSSILKLCHLNNISVVTLGGGTGLVQATHTDEHTVMLSTERLNKIIEIDPIDKTATVQSGVILQALHEASDAQGLLFPITLGAKGTCQLGGIASTNAGGNNVLLYGMTRASILGLTAVLADGTVIDSSNTLLKNNTGYDLKQLFIGSEGTLGVITELNVKLVTKPPKKQAALVALAEFKDVLTLKAVLQRDLNDQISSFEVMWQSFYQVSTRSDEITDIPLDENYNYYVIVEFVSSDHTVFEDLFLESLTRLMEKGIAQDVVVANSTAEQASLWAIRENIGALFSAGELTAFDISLPSRFMADYVDKIRADIKQMDERIVPVFFGHIGDCNLHLTLTYPNDVQIDYKAACASVYQHLKEYKGSVSAEHGIGLEKKPYLSICRTPEELSLMKQLKKSLDSKGILNPGKIFD